MNDARVYNGRGDGRILLRCGVHDAYNDFALALGAPDICLNRFTESRRYLGLQCFVVSSFYSASNQSRLGTIATYVQTANAMSKLSSTKYFSSDDVV